MSKHDKIKSETGSAALRETRRTWDLLVSLLLPLGSQGIVFLIDLLLPHDVTRDHPLWTAILAGGAGALLWLCALWLFARLPELDDGLGERIRPFAAAAALHLLLWFGVPLVSPVIELVHGAVRGLPLGGLIEWLIEWSFFLFMIAVTAPWCCLVGGSYLQTLWPLEAHGLMLVLIHTALLLLFLLFCRLRRRPARRDGSEGRWLRLLALCFAVSLLVFLFKPPLSYPFLGS